MPNKPLEQRTQKTLTTIMIAAFIMFIGLFLFFSITHNCYNTPTQYEFRFGLVTAMLLIGGFIGGYFTANIKLATTRGLIIGIVDCIILIFLASGVACSVSIPITPYINEANNLLARLPYLSRFGIGLIFVLICVVIVCIIGALIGRLVSYKIGKKSKD
jgi:hypothetical protein